LIDHDALEDSVVLTIDFGSMGNSGDFKVGGWQDPEHGFTWTLGQETSLAFVSPESPGRYALELAVSPFVFREKLPAQRLVVRANDEEIGRFELQSDAVLTAEIPWNLLARRQVCVVEFELPDAAKPIEVSGVPDSRAIALAFEQVRLIRVDEMSDERNGASVAPRRAEPKPNKRPTSPADLKDLMMRFESLGEDCEFGLVQRHCGAEPLGLLRFSSTPLPKLIAALDARFEGLGRPDMVHVELSSNGREYMVMDKRFGLYYHAWVLAGEKTPEEIHARECRRLPFLARKLTEDLQEATKIFVYRGMSPLWEDDIHKLAKSMRAYGPNTLLWVEADGASSEVGSVEELKDGLFKGHIERFAPASNAHEFSIDAWVDVCRNAMSLYS
jgi:hypothetical protein